MSQYVRIQCDAPGCIFTEETAWPGRNAGWVARAIGKGEYVDLCPTCLATVVDLERADLEGDERRVPIPAYDPAKVRQLEQRMARWIETGEWSPVIPFRSAA